MSASWGANKKFAEQLAAKLLKEVGISSAPIHLGSIARHLQKNKGLEIRAWDLDALDAHKFKLMETTESSLTKIDTPTDSDSRSPTR